MSTVQARGDLDKLLASTRPSRRDPDDDGSPQCAGAARARSERIRPRREARTRELERRSEGHARRARGTSARRPQAGRRAGRARERPPPAD